MPSPDPWPKGQALHLSIVEAAFSGALATLTSVVLQRVVYPWMGLHVATETTVKLAGFYCAWTFIRQLVIRRVFNRVDFPAPDPIDYGLDEEEEEKRPAPPRVILGRTITPENIGALPHGGPVVIPTRSSPGFDESCDACQLLGRPCAEHRQR